MTLEILGGSTQNFQSLFHLFGSSAATTMMVEDDDSYTRPSPLPPSRPLRRMKRNLRPALLAVFMPVLILTMAQMRRLSSFPFASHDNIDASSPPSRPRRLAVVNFVDDLDYYLWGVFSIHNQMQKFNMTARHVALIPENMSKKSKTMLHEWLGKENVKEVDKNLIRKKVPKGLWIPVFNKLEAFNMADEFDKLIVLDNDILIRQNIEHWFDYPAPAATHARGTIEWNSGAMVIEPNSTLYKILLDHVSLTRPWKPSKDDGVDTWNSYDGHQGFLSAFFTSNVTDDEMFTMSYASSMLSTDLEKRPENYYYWKYRRNTIETIHFTQHKPWKKVTETSNPAACSMLREWLESVASAPKEKLPKLPDFLSKCPSEATDLDVAEPAFSQTKTTGAESVFKFPLRSNTRN